MDHPTLNPPIPGHSIPSLDPSLAVPVPAGSGPARSLLELMSDGFHLLMLLKRGRLPGDAEAFVGAVQRFLEEVERGGHRLGIAAEDVYAARFAFCAAVDEAMLSQPSALREEWERNPLQLRLFGEHLAGEHFFDRLEELRARGAPRLPSLEVCHYVLLLGFQGKYRIEGSEKLGYLVARLGDEITYLKGKRAAFSPHWLPPDRVSHALRRVMPLWAPAAVLTVVGLLGWLGLDRALAHDSQKTLAAYQEVVQMPGRPASVSITLPCPMRHTPRRAVAALRTAYRSRIATTPIPPAVQIDTRHRPPPRAFSSFAARSEERRVGKEGRPRGSGGPSTETEPHGVASAPSPDRS